jgi:hypothetical protein
MSERYFTYREDDQHYVVVDSDDAQLGTVTETEDGWRAYDINGSELPGGEVYASQHDAGAALDAYRESGGQPPGTTEG